VYANPNEYPGERVAQVRAVSYKHRPCWALSKRRKGAKKAKVQQAQDSVFRQEPPVTLARALSSRRAVGLDNGGNSQVMMPLVSRHALERGTLDSLQKWLLEFNISVKNNMAVARLEGFPSSTPSSTWFACSLLLPLRQSTDCAEGQEGLQGVTKLCPNSLGSKAAAEGQEGQQGVTKHCPKSWSSWSSKVIACSACNSSSSKSGWG